MKNTITNLIIFASAGAIFQIGPSPFADENRILNQPAGAQVNASAEFPSSSQIRRASHLLGAGVHNQQNEKLGDIKDLMVDLPSGRVPFAVLSSGGLLGVGDQLVAVPVSSFAQSTDDRTLVLNMDKQRLQSAPSFARNNWPDMNDPTWSSRVYSFYGQQPAFESRTTQAYSSTRIEEPAGAERYSAPATSGQPYRYGGIYAEKETEMRRDRTPRKGLGAEDLTRNEQKTSDAESRTRSEARIREEAGAEPQAHDAATIHRESTTTQQSHLAAAMAGKTRRASDLIGMEVKNNQNERVGEVKDLVIDLNSGRVTYAVISAGGFLGMGDRLYAVPPSVLKRASDEQTLVFNTDKETLRAAPSFEGKNWSEATADQRFATEVYRYYGQQPYWQRGGEIREPAGGQPRILQQPDPGWERGYYNPQQPESRGFQEPSGAATSTPKSTAAGADQAVSETDRLLTQRVRSSLQSDTTLSSQAHNVQVSAENGRIILRGSVASEDEKRIIEDKVKQAAIDNQLEVKSSNPQRR